MDFINSNKKYIFAFIIVLLVIMIVILIYYLLISHKFLSGLWVCDDDFCLEGEINQMIVYIGESKIFCKRKICVIMLDANNSPYQFCFDAFCDPLTKKMIIKSDEETIFPSNMSVNLSVMDGSLILYDSEKEYARLYKDNINNN